MMALIYTVVGVPYIAWLWILGGFSAASLLGSLVPVSAVTFLLVVRREEAWVWIYPLGVAPLLTCLAGAEVSGAPALFMALLMGAAGMNCLHDDRRSVIISWACCTVGFGVLSHAQDPNAWGLGAAIIASLMHLTISLMLFFKAEQHRAALATATRATREAQTALGQANEALKTRERFLASMTHELRTPLSGIIGMGLLLPPNVSPEVKDIIDTINASATSLLEIVNDVLMFSKGKSGTLELRTSVFSPVGAIREAVRSISAQAHQKGLELLFDFGADVPASMNGDELRFRQVMINLVGNALKFTQRGSVVVRVSYSPGPGSLCVEVVDTGIGIPSERLASVFEPFVQVDDSHSRRFGGTGLGLAITSQLIGLMGGRLEAESQVGVGSTFRFLVPVGAVEQVNGLVTVEKPYSAQDLQVAVNRLEQFSMARSTGPVTHAERLDALVVEDNSINARVAVGLLGKLGHRAVVAKNGVEALRELAVRRFDIVLMDMQMPEMDGLEATARIRQDELGTARHLPILMVTANTLPEHEEASLRAGADAMLAKPLSPEKLERMLRLLIGAGAQDAA